jgi:hypothetical protein
MLLSAVKAFPKLVLVELSWNSNAFKPEYWAI